MKSIKNLDDISDGRFYGINDMVEADSGGCHGCSVCCHGVGDLVVLTPFDVFEIVNHSNVSFDEILVDRIEMHLDDKIKLPHMRMNGESQRCSFLNTNDRCSIHGVRPNICRLFPLGRVYKEDDFKYFLQVNVCKGQKLQAIKVKKWIDIDNYHENKAFILEWYRLLKALTFRIKFIRDVEELNEINNYLLDTFYRIQLKEGENFYSAFYDRLPESKLKLGII